LKPTSREFNCLSLTSDWLQGFFDSGKSVRFTIGLRLYLKTKFLLKAAFYLLVIMVVSISTCLFSSSLFLILAVVLWFKLPFFRSLFPLIGAVEGSRSNAVSLLRSGQVVLTYPGGVPEIMASRFGYEHICWSGRTGFARVAIEAQVPVVPIASIGVNNGFMFLTGGKLLGSLLYRGLLRMGPAYNSYHDPLVIGILPIPLPFSTAVHFPLPCKVRYVVGDPIRPTVGPEHANNDVVVQEFANRIALSLQRLVIQYGNPV
jgi:1-acyl-sn-glycerol-3-phosphate acyltransferase